MEDGILYTLLERHSNAFLKGNLDEALKEFENGKNISVTLKGRTYFGLDKIRNLYESIVSNYAKREIKLHEIKPEVVGDMALIKANVSFNGENDNGGHIRFASRAEIVCSLEEDNSWTIHSIIFK